VFVTCFRNREERENPGAHLTSDCRGNLRIHAQEFKKKHGYQLRVGTEPEMMWLTKNEDGTPTGKGFFQTLLLSHRSIRVFKTSVHASYEICKSNGS
jgi:hypothetical protein